MQTQEIVISIPLPLSVSAKLSLNNMVIAQPMYTIVILDDDVRSFFSCSNVNWKGVLVVREISKDLLSSDVSSDEGCNDRQN